MGKYYTDYDSLIAYTRSIGLKSPSFNQELLWLYQQAFNAGHHFPDKNILELGTLNAISACVIGCGLAKIINESPGRSIETQVTSVDNYHEYGIHGASNNDVKSFDQNLELIQDLGYGNIVGLVKSDDIVFLKSVPDGSLSMLSVDSWHDYVHVLETLAIALPKMCIGAIICGHDYALGNNGVVLAVEEWREANKDRLFGFGTHYRNWWTLVRAA